ncbi:MAG TPA: methyltransferase domain-containing protein [Terriglobia bacterium]|nr:methyltransferase domain-containing protein [Terriglobia bacterium]
MDYSRRANIAELMDDLSRPDAEFAAAYRELELINRRLGGVRAVERFLPSGALSVLDVAAGGCDVGEAVAQHGRRFVVSLDLNPRGLRRARLTAPVTADARTLPFADGAFDVVTASLFFHHLQDNECVQVLKEMWRVARRRVIVNDLHRHPAAYAAIRLLSVMFRAGAMVQHDGPVSVLRAFKPRELAAIAAEAGVPAVVHRSFPYRLVLVANKR